MFNLFKRIDSPGKGSAKSVPEKDKTLTPDQLSQWYLDQALAFTKSERDAERKSEKMAWRVAGGAMVLAGISIAGASANMFVKRPNPPVVWSHDSRTGEVVQLRALSDGKIDLGKATDLHYLSLYINYRESYDWENIQDFYNATLQLSSEEEGKQYKKLMNPEPTNDKSPVNKYKKNFRVIAKAGPISWVGDTALVSYEKRIIPLNGVDKPFTEFWQATISRVYENVPKSDKDRGINVPGFRVTSFTPVRDMTRTAAETIPAANGGAP